MTCPTCGDDRWIERDDGKVVPCPDCLRSDLPLSAFDTEAAREKTEEAVERVDRNADEDWKVRANQAIFQVCNERTFFTADDIWQKVEKPREPRALGPAMRRAVKTGWCAPTGRRLKSKIPVHHQCPVAEYVSLLHSPGRQH